MKETLITARERRTRLREVHRLQNQMDRIEAKWAAILDKLQPLGEQLATLKVLTDKHLDVLQMDAEYTEQRQAQETK